MQWQIKGIFDKLGTGDANRIDSSRGAKRSFAKEPVLGLTSTTKFILDLDKNNSIDGLVKKVRVSYKGNCDNKKKYLPC